MENGSVDNLQAQQSSVNTPANPNTFQNPPAQNDTTVLKKAEDNNKRSIFFKIILIVVPILVLVLLSIGAYFVVDKARTPAKIKEKVSVSQPLFMNLENSNEKIIDYVINKDTAAEAGAIERQTKKEQATVDLARKTEAEIRVSLQDTNLKQLENYKKLMEEYISETNKLLLFAEARINQQKAYKEPLEKHNKMSLMLASTGSLGVTDPDEYIVVLNEVISGEQKVIQDLKKIKINNPNRQESHENFISQLENTVAYIIQIRDIYQSYNATALLLAQTEHAQKKAALIKEANRLNDEIEEEAEGQKDRLESLSQQIEKEHSSLKAEYNF